MGVLSVGDGAKAEGDEVGDERVGVGARRDRRERPDERLAERADERRGGEVRVLGGQLAGGDAGAQDRREVLDVGPAEREALGLDGRIDRLREQRPRLAAGTQRAAGEGLDRRAQGRRRTVAVGGDGRRPGRVDLALGDPAEDLGEELGLRGEVAVDGAGGDPGARGDRRDLRLPVAAAGDQLPRGGDDALAGGGTLCLRALGRPVRHRA
jgi:hypothetical protein